MSNKFVVVVEGWEGTKQVSSNTVGVFFSRREADLFVDGVEKPSDNPFGKSVKAWVETVLSPEEFQSYGNYLS